MGRSKVNSDQIKAKNLRRTFKHRKDGILKKAYELSTLCGVQVGVIINESNDDSTHHVWPRNRNDLQCILKRYQNTNPDKKTIRELKNMFDNNAMKEVDHIENLSVDQLRELVDCLNAKLGIVESKIDMIKGSRDSIFIDDILLEEPDQFPFDHCFEFDDNQVGESMGLRMNYGGGFCYECPSEHHCFDDFDRVWRSMELKMNYDDKHCCYNSPVDVHCFEDCDQVAKAMGLKMNYDDKHCCYNSPIDVHCFDDCGQVAKSMELKMNYDDKHCCYNSPIDVHCFDDCDQVAKSMVLKMNYDDELCWHNSPIDVHCFEDCDQIAKSMVLKMNYEDELGCYNSPIEVHCFDDFDRVLRSMELKMNYNDEHFCYNSLVDVHCFDECDQVAKSMVLKMNDCGGVVKAQESENCFSLAPWEKNLLDL